MIQGNKIFLEYYAMLDGKHRTSVLEKFEFQDGLITKSKVYYGEMKSFDIVLSDFCYFLQMFSIYPFQDNQYDQLLPGT